MTTMKPKQNDSAVREPIPSKKAKQSSPIVKYYLIAYNVLSALAWGYILLKLLLHLSGLQSTPPPPTSGHTASSTLSALFSALPWERVSKLTASASLGSSSSSIWRNAPNVVKPLVKRARTSYMAVGVQTGLVQSAAVLEVVHALMGWVRSPVGTTAMQVASRLFTVWGVVECFEVARTSPLFASMVFAWSLTEVIRYAFYASSLLTPGAEPYPLLWARYTTFFALYPIGAGSEAFLNYATLPASSPLPSFAAWARGAVWTPFDVLRGALFVIWWPSLYVLFMYMVSQRRKVLGKGAGRKLGQKPKTL